MTCAPSPRSCGERVGVRGLYQRTQEAVECAEGPPHPDRKRSDLSPQAGRGKETAALRYCTHPHVLRCGSTMSRSPSPSRLKQNTAIICARPGNNAIHHSPDTMKLAPSASMMPHSRVGGRTPSPMKERPAALRVAEPTVI